MDHVISLPRWLKPASQLNLWLLRAGLRIGTQHILTIPGRSTGLPRSTPVSIVSVDGQRYIVSAPDLQWVKNARSAGRGILTRARHSEQVTLTALPPTENEPIVREFPLQVPGGGRFFGLPSDPAAFAEAAPRYTVFRVATLELPTAAPDQPFTAPDIRPRT